MLVFKFGGASVKNAAAIENVARIITPFSDQPLVVVVSAMGKSTNALEEILTHRYNNLPFERELQDFKSFHFDIINNLFPEDKIIIDQKVNKLLKDLEEILSEDQIVNYGRLYDEVVCYGEYLSTTIVSEYLNRTGLNVKLINAAEYITTKEEFQDAHVIWKDTCSKIQNLESELNGAILLTQGFIGATEKGVSTTLGREGSDYTAAIFASCLEAESVTIWKDVPGILNADPKIIDNVTLFKELPYNEASEMTYYGASVIHPKTIKPLANKNIPLHVRSFENPDQEGTVIHNCQIESLPPTIILKISQCLFSFKVKDFTFINEQGISQIFKCLHDLNIRINIMQNSANSFSVCFDFNEEKVKKLQEMMGGDFKYYFNTGLTLVTLKNYDKKTLEKYILNQDILLEQRSRKNYRFLCSNPVGFDFLSK